MLQRREKAVFRKKFSTKCKTPDSRYAAKMQGLCQKIRKTAHNLKKSESKDAIWKNQARKLQKNYKKASKKG